MLRLRQVAFAANDLAAAEERLQEGLSLELCYRDPEIITFGLANALFPVGDQFLEIVSPVQLGTTAGRLLDKRGSDCGYMALFQTDDLAAVRKRLDAAGIRVVFDAVGRGIRGLHLHPKDVRGAIVSIDVADDPADWPWAGPSWREHVDRSVVSRIVGLEVAVDEPAAAAQAWASALGLTSGGTTLALDDAELRFVARAPDAARRGITGLDLVSTDRERSGFELDLLGVTVRFR